MRNSSLYPDIYVQRYNSSGTPLGSNFMVNDVPDSLASGSDIGMDTTGNFVICWSDYRNGRSNSDVYAQIYDLNGTPAGSNFRVNDDPGGDEQYAAVVAEDASSRFVIVWFDRRDGQRAYWAQRYSHLGTPLGSNFLVVGFDPSVTLIDYADVAMDYYGNFVVTWGYRKGYPDSDRSVYFRRYDSSGDPIYGIYPIPNLEYSDYDQFSPTVAANDSNIFFAWVDSRRSQGEVTFTEQDIYAKIIDWGWRAESAEHSGSFTGYSPIDLIITDPVGDSIGIDFNTIPGATYDSTQDLNEDGDKDDHVTIPEPLLGEYLVRVVAEPGADADYYSLTVKAGDNGETFLIDSALVPPQGEADSASYRVLKYLRGDANSNGEATISDAVFLINYLFKEGIPPEPVILGDVNCVDEVSIADVVYLINYLFKDGPPPCS
jgi:hypothetical protein